MRNEKTGVAEWWLMMMMKAGCNWHKTDAFRSDYILHFNRVPLNWILSFFVFCLIFHQLFPLILDAHSTHFYASPGCNSILLGKHLFSNWILICWSNVNYAKMELKL